MKNLFKKFIDSHLYLLVAALILFATAFLLNKYVVGTTSASFYSLRIQHKIREKENAFNRLAADTALLNSLIDQRYKESDLKKLLDEKIEFGFFVYEKIEFGEPRLLFWNTQSAIPPINLLEETNVSRLVTLANGLYVHVSKFITLHDRQYSVEALIPVMWKYFIEIANLKTEFDGFPDALQRVDISYTATDYPVKSSYGNTLFHLKQISSQHQRSSWWTMICAFVGVFLFFWFVHYTAHRIAEKWNLWWGVLFLLTILTLLRLGTYYFPQVLDLRQFELFDPTIYGSSFVLSSLGDLFINALLFCWVAVFVNRRIGNMTVVPFITKWKNWLLSIFLLAVIVASTFVVARILQSMVADARISFNVTNYDSLSEYSFVGFIILATLVLGYFFLAQVVFKMLRELLGRSNNVLYIIAGFLGLSILSFTRDPEIVELNLFVLIWFTGFMWMMQQEVFSGLRFRLNVSEVLFWLFVFSFSIAAVIVAENRKIELEQRKIFAEKLAVQADPANERLLSIALTYLDNDFLSPNFEKFKNPISNARLKDSIINTNFGPYLNKFDTRIYTFDNASSPKPLYNDDPISFDTLNTIFRLQGKTTNIASLRYFERAFDKYSYISLKEVKDVDSSLIGYFFILADPKRYKNDALIPELFKQSKELLPEYSPLYSYAIYSGLELINYYNEYAFPIRLSPGDVPRPEFEQRRNGAFEELWYHSADKVVVVARKNNSFLEAITLFAYLFSTFLFLLALYWVTSLILRSRFQWGSMRRNWQFSIRMQIHSTIIMISLLSFIVIGAATILFFINRYERNNQERLSRAMQIMINQVQKRLDDHEQFNDGVPLFEVGVNSSLERMMADISEIHGTDVNLYDTLGNLKVTSKPLIYNKGVLSEKMNPDAYYSLHIQKAVQTVKNERMGKVDYLSIYNPIRNKDGTVYAYLNVPSYSTQDELKQEISNFLVTLINLNAFIFLVAGAISLLITNRITYSFTLIGHKMREINLRKMNEEIEWKRRDEIGELVKEYNKMVQKLAESAEALAKSEREGAWRQMARQVAHEIKNPLTPMKLSIQYLQKAIDNNSSNVKEMTSNVARTLVEQIDHLSKIASDFSQFANIGNPRKEVFDLHELLYSLSSLYEATDNLDFTWTPLDHRVLLFADKTQLNRLFTNLLQNALDAASTRDRKAVMINEELSGEYIVVSVTDNGEGIPEQTRSKIFTPNFTTKTSGTGLGLAMSKSIIENAEGEIWFETKEEEGTTFYVKIPLLRATS
ncbi:MAG: HAMP domain-containing histidine kinase [Chitinophagaceae bacterium]|nr:HAMP domain-containing histidine kinase [Chitinophagaceae bacterium]